MFLWNMECTTQYLFLLKEIRWIPYHEYVDGNGVLVAARYGIYFGRHYIKDGYVIGKVETKWGFNAAYRGITYNRKSGHQVLNQNKGMKNGCPWIVQIRGTQGCALVGDPARAVQARSRDTTLSASDLHNARQPFLIPFITWDIK